jgi:cytochrome c peroxidase
MKKNTLITSFVILLFVGFMSISFNTSQKKVVFTFMNDAPNLPETPYEYSDIEFPQHVFDDDIPTGYEGHPTDTTVLDFVDDDISTLGRVLFYDEKLSALENLSCASCHSQEFSFAENTQFSQGISSLTTRNSMALNDLSWEGKTGFFWDMEFSNLEDMLDIPFKDENEIGADIDEVVIKMNNTDYYPELFEMLLETL